MIQTQEQNLLETDNKNESIDRDIAHTRIGSQKENHTPTGHVLGGCYVFIIYK